MTKNKTDTIEEIKQLREKVNVSNDIQQAVYDWVKEDAPVSVMLVVTPDILDALVKKIYKKIEKYM
jgi:predicted DNA-binding protein (UPF0278 family)